MAIESGGSRETAILEARQEVQMFLSPAALATFDSLVADLEQAEKRIARMEEALREIDHESRAKYVASAGKCGAIARAYFKSVGGEQPASDDASIPPVLRPALLAERDSLVADLEQAEKRIARMEEALLDIPPLVNQRNVPVDVLEAIDNIVRAALSVGGEQTPEETP